MNGVPVSCLIDSGASHNFFLTGLIARVGCTTSYLFDSLCINLADGRKTTCSREQATIDVSEGSVRERETPVTSSISR